MLKSLHGLLSPERKDGSKRKRLQINRAIWPGAGSKVIQCPVV
jgi:hypothetical protein